MRSQVEWSAIMTELDGCALRLNATLRCHIDELSSLLHRTRMPLHRLRKGLWDGFSIGIPIASSIDVWRGFGHYYLKHYGSRMLMCRVSMNAFNIQHTSMSY